jgi:toxin FitB
VVILDTTILEEVLKPGPEMRIAAWLAAQPREDVYTTALTQAKVMLGVERLPPGKRRSELLAAIADIFAFFEKRVLPFDADAARAYPTIAINRQMMGRELPPERAMLAAIVRSRGATLATRSTAEFAGCGVRVVSPWESA